MKRKLFLIIILVAGLNLINAQTRNELVNIGPGFGFQLNQYQKDFGFGLNISSRFFAHDKLSVRLRGNLMYNENVQNGDTDWTTYANVSVGLIGIGGMVGDHIRLYGEGGFIGLIPSDKFSSDDFVFGGYGFFGFEFFNSKGNNYFIEIGGVGTGAHADKIENNPVYSNGLVIGTGLRIYLK
ncbi:MAG: hypothetical protein MUC78_10165 [Bacteroidales bacterium]|jgi:hypothetical protein|nr:hypothetical protein [Bacteroidales bacterium]